MKSFLHSDHPWITPLLESQTEDDLLQEIKGSLEQGADAFGLQIERLPAELRTEEKLKLFFAAMGDCPIYVTCYKSGDVVEETEEDRAQTIMRAMHCGADLADIRGDMFCPCDSQMTYDEAAIQKQMDMIREIHAMGKEALISCHVSGPDGFVFLNTEEVVAIALEQQRRGADIAKIVARANSEAEVLEDFASIHALRERVSIPTLFLTNGSQALRHRIAGPLIYEPMVFVKEKRYASDSKAQQPIERIAKLFEIVGFRK